MGGSAGRHLNLRQSPSDYAESIPAGPCPASEEVGGHEGAGIIEEVLPGAKLTVHGSGTVLTLFEKTIKGSLFGSGNPQRDILKMLDLYQAGNIGPASRC